MKNFLLLFLAGSVVLACTKSGSSASSAPITMQSLAGNYKITSAKAGGIDILSVYLKPCQLDDIYTLNSNGSYQVTDAGVTCSPSTNSSGSWSLSGMQITLGTQQFTIVSYDGSRLEATTVTTQNGITATIDVIFTRQ